jgi:hypothetical protein
MKNFLMEGKTLTLTAPSPAFVTCPRKSSLIFVAISETPAVTAASAAACCVFRNLVRLPCIAASSRIDIHLPNKLLAIPARSSLRGIGNAIHHELVARNNGWAVGHLHLKHEARGFDD